MNSVFIEIPITDVVEAAAQPTKTYRLDLDKGRIVGMTDGVEALMQAIRKAIITPRFKCLVYDNQYGSEVEEAIIAKDASQEYARAVIPAFIKDCLLPDDRIIEVKDFEIEFQNDGAYISFTADTIYGTARIEEVI